MTDIIGQDEALARLDNEFASGRVAHAYMLEGARGVGKTVFARALAARRLCRSPDARGRACGMCRSCVLMSHGTHPDYLELPRGQAELRIARFVERAGGAEAAEHQPLLPFLRLRPVEGGRRAAVVPDAERMRPEAANAFLKTLEEPPGDALIILTVGARDRLPATVSSRCRRIVVKPLAVDVLAAELERRGAAAGDDARDLALASEGSLGMALELAEGGTLKLWRWLEGEAFARPGAQAARALADALLSHGTETGDNAGKRGNAVAALDLAALAIRRRMRGGLSPGRAAAALEALWNGADQVARNVRPDLALLSAAFEAMSALR